MLAISQLPRYACGMERSVPIRRFSPPADTDAARATAEFVAQFSGTAGEQLDAAGDELGVSPWTIYRWRTGKAIPRAQKLRLLRRRLAAAMPPTVPPATVPSASVR